jgi:hypothetical protein
MQNSSQSKSQWFFKSVVVIVVLPVIYFLITNFVSKANGSDSSSNQSRNFYFLSDSTKPTIIQQQNQHGNNEAAGGDIVHGDKVSGNKITNNYPTPKKGKKDTTIVNNGFLNQGGNGNTYNQKQYFQKNQRHVSAADDSWIRNNFPKQDSAVVKCVLGDQESEVYAREIVQHLNDLGIKAIFSGWSVFLNQQYGKIVFQQNDSLKMVTVAVFSNITN